MKKEDEPYQTLEYTEGLRLNNHINPFPRSKPSRKPKYIPTPQKVTDPLLKQSPKKVLNSFKIDLLPHNNFWAGKKDLTKNTHMFINQVNPQAEKTSKDLSISKQKAKLRPHTTFGLPATFPKINFESFSLSHYGSKDTRLSSFPPSLPWQGEKTSQREGKTIPVLDQEDITDSGGQSGALGSFQWWSAHPVVTLG